MTIAVVKAVTILKEFRGENHELPNYFYEMIYSHCSYVVYIYYILLCGLACHSISERSKT